jgi:type IV fimbrial biogenesis protein FimT
MKTPPSFHRSIAKAGAAPFLTGGNMAAVPTMRIGRAFRNAAGFNLVEMLVVITLAAILTCIGVPSYRYVTYSNRVSSEINGLLGDMQLARAEAMKRGVPVSVCPTTNFTACATSPNWQTGWLVFSDLNGDGTITASDNDAILRVQQPFSSTSSTDTLAMSNPAVNAITFNRTGLAIGLPSADVLLTLHTTPNSTQWVRCLDITVSGMMAAIRSGAATIGTATGTCT